MDSYWDLYVAYVNKCVKENKEQGFDPHHYAMEWNHFLPKCIFGDQPVGHWLTIKQHAIASALQTLTFKQNCMTGMMKKYLPEKLLELAWHLYGKKGELNPMFGKTGEFNPNYGKKRPDQSEKRLGEGNPMFGRTHTEKWKKTKSEQMTGERNFNHGKKLPDLSEKMTGEGNHSFGKKWWVNAKGETYLGFKPPEPDWQLGRKFKQTEVKND